MWEDADTPDIWSAPAVLLLLGVQGHEEEDRAHLGEPLARGTLPHARTGTVVIRHFLTIKFTQEVPTANSFYKNEINVNPISQGGEGARSNPSPPLTKIIIMLYFA